MALRVDKKPREAAPLCLLLAGGEGLRFWPLSNPQKPKQFLNLLGRHTLLAQTLSRLKPFIARRASGRKRTSYSPCLILTTQALAKATQAHAPDVPLILEPERRNTHASLLWATTELIRKGTSGDTPIGIFPCDHAIRDTARFRQTCQRAWKQARRSSRIILVGIPPRSPHTGYGYICTRQVSSQKKAAPIALEVKAFIEKPKRNVAQKLIHEKTCYWNSGMVFARLGTLSEAFQKYAPKDWQALSQARNHAARKRAFSQIKKQPFDSSILEKAPCSMVKAQFHWNDLGSWNALYDEHASPRANNVVLGNAHLVDTHDCLVTSHENTPLLVVGARHLIIVKTQSGVLIAHRECESQLKKILMLWK